MGSRAKPFRIRRGVFHTQFRAIRQGLGKHERGGGLEPGAEQIARAGRFETKGPPVLVVRAELGELHRAPGLVGQLTGARRDSRAGQRVPVDSPLLAYRPPAVRGTAVLAERAERKGPLLPVLHTTAGAAGTIEDSRAAAEHFHLQRPARANLHRQPSHVRIEKVVVFPRLHLELGSVEPSSHRHIQLARQNPAHLETAGSLHDRSAGLRDRHRHVRVGVPCGPRPSILNIGTTSPTDSHTISPAAAARVTVFRGLGPPASSSVRPACLPGGPASSPSTG